MLSVSCFLFVTSVPAVPWLTTGNQRFFRLRSPLTKRPLAGYKKSGTGGCVSDRKLDGFAYYAYIIFALVISVLSFFRRITGHNRYIRFVRISLLVLAAHLILEMTYIKWSYALFSK